jgi:hypothetical protein
MPIVSPHRIPIIVGVADVIDRINDVRRRTVNVSRATDNLLYWTVT